MAGSFRSRLYILAAALGSIAGTIAAVATNYVQRSWRRAIAWFDAGLTWLVERMPKQPHDWYRAWHRVAVLAVLLVQRTVKRRPLVSPRWRMCPSI